MYIRTNPKEVKGAVLTEEDMYLYVQIIKYGRRVHT